MAAAPSPSLRRQLGLWSAIAVLVGSTIGSGIFRSPAGIATRLPGPLPLVGVFVAAGILALCGALTLAEVGSAYPRTGGIYVYIREAFGRLPAFLFGWAEFVVIRAASLGAISITCAEYTLRVAGFDPSVAPYDDWAHWLAAVAIVVSSSVNVLGVKSSSVVQNVTTIAKYGGLLFIVLLAFAIGLPKTGGHFAPLAPPGSFTFGAFGLALVSTLWIFDGWADVSFVGGEIKDAQRTLPKALVLGTLLVLAIYLAAIFAYLSVLSVQEIAGSRLVAADVAQRLIGPAGVLFVSVTVMLSTFGTLNGTLLTAPRIFVAMADDGLFFRALGRVHPKFETPYVAVLTCAALGVAFVLLRSFEQLADAFVTAIVPFYALAVASVYALRRRAGYAPTFRVPGYPLVPALFILSTIFLLGNAIADESSRMATLGVLGVIVAGIPVYHLVFAKGAAATAAGREG